MKWSEKTWQESAEIFDKILNQSFNQDLILNKAVKASLIENILKFMAQ